MGLAQEATRGGEILAVGAVPQRAVLGEPTKLSRPLIVLSHRTIVDTEYWRLA